MSLIEKAEIKFRESGIKETTLKNLMTNIKKVIDNTGIKTLTEKNKEKVMGYINTIENKNTRNNALKPITKYLKDDKKKKKLYEYYLNEMKNVVENIKKEVDKNEYTEEEKKNLIEWDKIKKINIDNLNDLDTKIFLSFIINDNLFLRLAYFKIKLNNYEEEKDNYIKKGKLYMNDFKNIKPLGKQVFSLTNKTKELVKKREGQEYLFTNHGLQNSGLSKFVKRIFRDTINKEINNNLLRKIFISSHDLNKMTNEEIERIGKKLLTTTDMFTKHYRKVGDK